MFVLTKKGRLLRMIKWAHKRYTETNDVIYLCIVSDLQSAIAGLEELEK